MSVPRRTIAIVIAIALLLAGGITVVAWASSPAPPSPAVPSVNATLDVNGTAPVTVLSAALWGVNLRADYPLPGAQTTVVGATAATLVRWPGGGLSDRYDLFGPGGRPWIYNSTGAGTPAPSTAAQFVTWCRHVGCQAIVTVPGEIDSPGFAAQEVAYFEEALHFTPAYWEIGNEPALWEHFGVAWANWSTLPRVPPTPDQYASEVAAYISAMRAVDPAARFIGLPGVGSGASSESTWLSATIAGNGANLSAVALHVYPAGVLANATPTEFYRSLSGPESVPTRYAAAQSVVATRCPGCDIAVLIDELGPGNGDAVPADLAGFPMGLYDATEALQAMEVNVSAAVFWVAQGEYPAAWVGPDGAATPVATLFTELLHPLPNELLVSRTTPTGTGLTAIALRVAGNASRAVLLVTNTNLSTAFRLRGSLPGPIAGGELTVWTAGGLLRAPLAASAAPMWSIPPSSVVRIDLNFSSTPRDGSALLTPGPPGGPEVRPWDRDTLSFYSNANILLWATPNEVQMTTEIATVESPLPWNEIDQAFEDVRRQFFDAFGFRPEFESSGASPLDRPLRSARMDIEETPNAYRLTVEVPGIPKENVSVTVRSATVEVRGEFASAKEETTPNYLRRERGYAGFFRSVELPEPVVAEKAVAKVEHGVLTLELPKQNPEPVPVETKVPVQ